MTAPPKQREGELMPATYNDLYLDARKALKAAGVEQAQLEARELLCFASGKSREEFIRDLPLYASDGAGKRFRGLLERRRQEKFVTLHTGDEIVKVSVECINYVEARGRGCVVGRMRVQEGLEVRESLSELEGLLDPEQFMRCHRSYLCRIANIRQISREDVEFDDGSIIPVSRRLYSQVNQRFIAYFRRDRCT